MPVPPTDPRLATEAGAILVRPATLVDAGLIAAVHVKAWRSAYAGLVPDHVLASLDAAAWAEHRLARIRAGGGPWAAEDHVAEQAGTLVGFVTIGNCRDEDAVGGDGEIFAIYVDPDRWGSGIGRALMAVAERRLRVRGAPRVVLWVLEGNPRARGFYEREGFVADGTTKPWVAETGETLPEIRYVKPL